MTTRIALAFAAGLAAFAAQAWPAEPLSDAALKREYLACERTAAQVRPAGGEAARCSVIYEALKAQVFDGDWQSLRAWSERHLVPEGS